MKELLLDLVMEPRVINKANYSFAFY